MHSSEIQSDSIVVAHEEHVQETAEHDENHNPNSTEKRSLEDVKLLMSSKKHASCELKFQSFQVNWNKLSDNILSRLQSLQNFRNESPTQCVPRSLQLTKADLTGVANSVVDQLRTIDTHIRADILEGVAKQVLNMFPCLNFVDDDGFGSGTGHVWLKHKMINRNSYLNRYKEPYVPKADTMEIRRNRNVRAGTIKEYWEETNNECTKEVISKLSRDEPGLLTPEFLQASQSYVRYRFDEKIPLKDVLGNLPVLRRRILLKYHFECATGVSADSLEQYFTAKRSKIIDFSKTSRKISPLDSTAPDYNIFKFLCSLLGDKIEDVIVLKEIGTKIDGITIDCSGPVLVAIEVQNEREHMSQKVCHLSFQQQKNDDDGGCKHLNLDGGLPPCRAIPWDF
ncbi:uncharacterized protein LOC135708483 [Ochlerotatus camptorhynchus]|uniref:uncharacterized protein LOC135708483 n=1 Tax=Ochlerotatus camptorhynchus TaxID=644619 RepID=UPI0031E2D710